MSSYFITGATGFIGRRVLPRLLAAQPDAVVYALIRPRSVEGFTDIATGWDGSGRLHLVPGDLTADALGIADDAAIPDHVDHVLHLGAVYDMTADATSQQAANVEGTSRVADFALAHDAMMHHVSSIAVSGDHRGIYTEDDFDLGQRFPTPYHRTKFGAEKAVRERAGLRWRVYRPAIVVGDSTTGEMNKIDGPYYFFGHLRRLGTLPSGATVPMPNLGDTNVVPVDFVADAIVALLGHRPDQTGRVYHLVDPDRRSITDLYNAVAPAFGGPRGRHVIPRRIVAPVVAAGSRGVIRTARDLVALQQKIPPAVLDTTELPAVFITARTTPVLDRYGISVPDLAEYGPRLFEYWAENLDPNRFARTDPRGPLVGKHVLITGGSAGIGLETARICARKGATVFILARKQDDLDTAVRDIGSDLRTAPTDPDAPTGSVHAYVCDITDAEAVAVTVKTILTEHDHVDVLVNNAGRSIRRATINATDRSHDYHRTMAVNYFGAVEMVLALLPHMTGRRIGHIVNVSSIGVQARGPRFAAYVASKSALEAFSDITAAETLSDRVTFTNIHMPLTRTRMIAPTDSYDKALALTAEKAAAIVVRGIVEKPKRIDTPLGTLAQVGQFLLPGLTARVQHQGFLLFGESTAAQGKAEPTDVVAADGTTAASAAPVSPTMSIVHSVRDRAQAVAHPVKSAVVDSGARRIVRRSLNLVPGVHW
ncbi:SDR family oxidoreductase [Williamsia phyllosphaerae]|uniref:Short chain dehydrogenase n=1 Tax=Williamsia phyllosphaerae TaxID=885042 RepID=A0ABQ1UZS8_9NOCA|nr:SDR family oxidoreductase [Williamsia phyllosphaerae]GGF32024.1 short chain dehydrogenase [Williamsia phyllosphaerae]